MTLNLKELRIIERLLVNRQNSGFDPELCDLLGKVMDEIEEKEYEHGKRTEQDVLP